MSFDFAAFFYDFLVRIVFGKRLYEAQVALFGALPKNTSVLIIGGGTGEFLNQFITEVKPVNIDYLEASLKMLDIALRKHQDIENIRFIHGNENSLDLGMYDVVLTPFVLDLYSEKELMLMVHKIQSKLNPGAVWLVTDFYTDKDSPFMHRALLKTMYLFFNLISGVKARQLPDYENILKQNYMHLMKGQMHVNGFVRSLLYQAAN